MCKSDQKNSSSAGLPSLWHSVTVRETREAKTKKKLLSKSWPGTKYNKDGPKKTTKRRIGKTNQRYWWPNQQRKEPPTDWSLLNCSDRDHTGQDRKSFLETTSQSLLIPGDKLWVDLMERSKLQSKRQWMVAAQQNRPLPGTNWILMLTARVSKMLLTCNLLLALDQARGVVPAGWGRGPQTS